MQFTPINFTCEGCGAPLKFSPATGKLTCEFCNRSYAVESNTHLIREYDLRSALTQLEQNRPKEITKEITCPNCGSGFTLTPYTTSTNCPYCGTPTITEFVNKITPESILPFTVTHTEAQKIFAKWIGSLWLAPNALKTLVDTDKSLKGYYLPYWTYDAETSTAYRGKRGDIYYVMVQRRRIINGKEQIVTVREPRIRWTPTAGRVERYFDDVTIEASETLSRKILSALGNWDTSQSKPFDEKYLSGFESEEYAIGLDNGFEMAQAKMHAIIRRDIRRDIGGDKQQIDQMQTHYANTTYKSALFPVWTTHFDFNGKSYYFAINGQSGEITGERPYSYTKIILLIVMILAIMAALGYYGEFFDQGGFGTGFDPGFGGGSDSYYYPQM